MIKCSCSNCHKEIDESLEKCSYCGLKGKIVEMCFVEKIAIYDSLEGKVINKDKGKSKRKKII